MRTASLLLLMFLVVEVFLFNFNIVRDTQPCQYKGDEGCPVWNGWSDPKCHVDTNPQECRKIPDQDPPKWMCWKLACTFCHAKGFGCSTDLIGGVEGTIAQIAPIQAALCGDPQIISQGSGFKVHCGCGGSCLFHGTYKVFYYTSFPPQDKIVE